MSENAQAKTLLGKIADRSARVGVIGMGYVGLPLAVTIARKGLKVTGFDIDTNPVAALNGGKSHIEAVSDEELEAREYVPRETIYSSGALWKYAQLVGSTRLGAVTHPGAKEEKHIYADL